MIEDKFLEKLIKKIKPLNQGEVGIGDDSALLFVPTGSILVTQDGFVEGVHFPSNYPLKYIIKRCIRATLSDINAMGGKGKDLFITLSIQREKTKELERTLNSILEECKKYELRLAGGDTTSSSKTFISVTLTGYLPFGKKPILRCNAKEGHNIYISGSIGKMALALRVIKGENLNLKEKEKNSLIKYFFKPEIPYPLGYEILFEGKVKAGIDISDGLGIDLHRLCRRSNCGAIIFFEEIPYEKKLLRIFPNEKERLKILLSSGEEFQLLFTSPFKLPFPKIGEIIKEKNILLKEKNKTYNLKPYGWDHF